MGEIVKFISEFFEKIKNKKVFAWIIIIFLILVIILYPIIDANFLYYERTKKRIDIIENITKLNINEIEKNDVLKGEYESILIDISNQKEKNINSIIRTECTLTENIIKSLCSSWIFILLSIVVLFSKDKKTSKINWKNNILTCIFCIIISAILIAVSIYIPIIINLGITCVLIESILLYLAYTISKFENRK